MQNPSTIRSRIRAVVLLVGVLPISASCGSSKSGDLDCKAIAEHIVEIARTDLAKLEKEQQQAGEAQLPTVRSELVERCERETDQFAAAQACILKASTKADIEACWKK